MGSFTEVCLSFDFAESTPDHVLAAFSALATAVLPYPHREPSPRLPTPVVEPDEFWSADDNDPKEPEPWLHDWASWVSDAMGAETTPHGLLVWSGYHWNLDCRFSWKTLPSSASQALEWLAPFVQPGYFPDRKVLVGYAKRVDAPRPWLFWVKEGRWELEDLNPNDDWQWG